MNFLRITLFAIVLIIIAQSPSNSCTNMLISKGASADGATMITYNADAGGFMEPFVYLPAQDWKAGDSVEVYDWDSGKYLGKIKQVAHTFSVVSHMNEYQVALGETTFGGRTELVDTTAKIDYGSLMRLALQRAKTAREAIKIMGELVAEYGYYSEGESFSVADPNEAWIMDLISKGKKERGAVWVAMRVPDGYISAHANQARIRHFPLNDPENCMYAKDVISFAEKMGYYNKEKNGEFSFVDAYCPLEPGGALYCEGRVWSLFSRAAPSLNLSEDYWRAVKGAEPYPLFIKPDKKLSYRDAIALMRDHFDGTKYDLSKGIAAGPYGCPVRWKGLVWKLDGDTVNSYGWERPISSQQCAFAFVTQSRNWLPREIGGIIWYGPDDNYTNVYVPLYCSMTEGPKVFSGHSNADFSLESGWWVFNLVANRAYQMYSYIYKDIQPVQKALEDKFANNQPAVEIAAQELYKKDPKLAIDYLTDYSQMESKMTVDRWRELWVFITMKYNDGYINDVHKAGGRHPASAGYPTWWLKKCIDDKPEGYYDIKWQTPDKKKAKKK